MCSPIRFRPTGFRPSRPWSARANTPGERIRPSSSTGTTWSAPSSPAFTLTPQQVGRRYPPSDTSLPARYARAIAAYRAGALKPALQQMDELIQSEPDNPYFRELKGQALLESGHPADAIDPLDKAVSLAPRSGLLRILYGQALVATEQKAMSSLPSRT